MSSSVEKSDVHDVSLTRRYTKDSALDKDDLILAQLGYEPELNRNFSVWSVLGVGFGLTNSWFGISASLVTGISSGGPMMIVYGIMIIAAVSTCIGITLSELASAYPSSGGQYVWAKVLAPKYPVLAFLCGSFSYAGSIFSSTSTTVATVQIAVAFYELTHADYEFKRWHVFVAFQILNFFIFFFNCYAKFLPSIAKSSLYISLGSFIVITITVLACSSGHFQDAKFVFSDFDNQTGWESAGIAFIIGLINPNWSFSCLDCATHMAEEVAQPERVIPIAIMGTVAIGFFTSFVYCISMFFSIRDLDALLNTATGAPIISIYYQALQNQGGAIFLGFLLFLTACGCLISGHTWQMRLCWSFARDNGLPFSSFLSKVDKRMGIPFNAHLFSVCLCSLVSCLYLASDLAYNSLVTGCITFLLLSYAIPVSCLIYNGRDSITHGPFWIGKFGYFTSSMTVAWALFALVFYSFPFVKPVTKSNMNYAAAAIVGWLVVSVVYWFSYGKKIFIMRNEDDEDAVLKKIFAKTESHREKDATIPVEVTKEL
ncbi:BA75_00544T0 [Komagataella pastoris]|uniref:BA75_00544T0 n=1 Tax=Komagataella pastoris TaxID=4922 RepID=A0A1B2J5E9_PICPA|nr:BA75_00544T0 [Komagataella pastoris]